MSEQKPLTLEELRKMDGKPVQYEATGEIFIVDLNNPEFGECLVNADGYYIPLHRAVDRAFGRRFFAYERPRLDRSAWEPCEHCKTCDTCKHQFGRMYCSKNGWGCKNGSNYIPKANFCSNCGRPLTDVAWEMLEKRLESRQ